MTTLRPRSPEHIKVVVTSSETEKREQNKRRAIARIVNTVKLTKVRDGRQKDYQNCMKKRSRLCKTSETEHTPGITIATALRTHLDQDTFDAFQSPTKIPALRKSPAMIRWPERDHLSMQVKKPPPGPKPRQYSLPDIPKAEVRNQKPKKKAPKKYDKGSEYEDEVTEFDDEDDASQSAPPWKPVAYASFWDTAYGNLRMDGHYIGAPRVDPHHSSWAPDARRCYFLRRPQQPPHTRAQSVVLKVPNQSHKDGRVSF